MTILTTLILALTTLVFVSPIRSRTRAVDPRAAKRSGASLSPFPPASSDPGPPSFFNPRPQTPNPRPHTNIRAGPIRVFRFIRG
jgi:hypothetical protein